MGVFRTDEMNQLYDADKCSEEFKTTCVLCSCEALQTFEHWKIIRAKFPYDVIATVHNMLLPLRHVTEQDLTIEELEEFMRIKHSEEIQHTYDSFIESTHRTRSIPPHFHLHLMVLK